MSSLQVLREPHDAGLRSGGTVGPRGQARAAEPVGHPFRIRRIDRVVLRVRDVHFVMDFYVRVLGCTVEHVDDAIGLYQLRAGDCRIDLLPVDGPLGRVGGAAPGSGGRNLDHVCLRVEPFDAERLRRHLGEQGVAYGAIEHGRGADGQGLSLYVTDPEGNVIELKGPAEAAFRLA